MEDRGEKNKIMNEVQKKKRNIRKSKAWDAKRKSERKRAGNKDEITLKPLRKGWALHHEDLDAENYGNLDGDDFLCVNNLTHKMIHWLWTYYKTDTQIIDRLRVEMIKMAEINKGEE